MQTTPRGYKGGKQAAKVYKSKYALKLDHLNVWINGVRYTLDRYERFKYDQVVADKQGDTLELAESLFLLWLQYKRVKHVQIKNITT
jgi:hypothetical protein